MRLCVKIGGAQLEDAAARLQLAQSVARAAAAGHEIIIVHGGGNQIRALTGRLGIEDRYHEGLRITDAPTAEAALMVLAGQVNKQLVQSLADADVPAVGLCGADGGGTFVVERHAPNGNDLGYVGTVTDVQPKLIDTLLAGGFIPVLATLAPLAAGATGERDHLYNVNADHAAAPLSRAFDCDAMLFLTDVPGVLDADKQRLESLTSQQCQALRDDGTISGGMIPKIDAALGAAAALATRSSSSLVKIAPAAGPDAVLDACRNEVGTRFEVTPS